MLNWLQQQRSITQDPDAILRMLDADDVTPDDLIAAGDNLDFEMLMLDDQVSLDDPPPNLQRPLSDTLPDAAPILQRPFSEELLHPAGRLDIPGITQLKSEWPQTVSTPSQPPPLTSLTNVKQPAPPPTGASPPFSHLVPPSPPPGANMSHVPPGPPQITIESTCQMFRNCAYFAMGGGPPGPGCELCQASAQAPLSTAKVRDWALRVSVDEETKRFLRRGTHKLALRVWFREEKTHKTVIWNSNREWQAAAQTDLDWHEDCEVDWVKCYSQTRDYSQLPRKRDEGEQSRESKRGPKRVPCPVMKPARLLVAYRFVPAQPDNLAATSPLDPADLDPSQPMTTVVASHVIHSISKGSKLARTTNNNNKPAEPLDAMTTGPAYGQESYGNGHKMPLLGAPTVSSSASSSTQTSPSHSPRYVDPLNLPYTHPAGHSKALTHPNAEIPASQQPPVKRQRLSREDKTSTITSTSSGPELMYTSSAALQSAVYNSQVSQASYQSQYSAVGMSSSSSQPLGVKLSGTPGPDGKSGGKSGLNMLTLSPPASPSPYFSDSPRGADAATSPDEGSPTDRHTRVHNVSVSPPEVTYAVLDPAGPPLVQLISGLMSTSSGRRQVVQAVQRRPYLGKWIKGPSSPHPPALTLYHPGPNVGEWDKPTTQVVFFFQVDTVDTASNLSFSPYSSLSCFPPMPAEISGSHRNNHLPPSPVSPSEGTQPPSLLNVQSNSSQPHSPLRRGSDSSQATTVSQPPSSNSSVASSSSSSTSPPARPSRLVLTLREEPGGGVGLLNNKSNGSNGQRKGSGPEGAEGSSGDIHSAIEQPALTPAALEASVFLGWRGSHIYFLGKYLYSKEKGRDESTVTVVRSPDGADQDELEPLTHILLQLRIPSRDVPTCLVRMPGLLSYTTSLLHASLSEYVRAQLAAPVIPAAGKKAGPDALLAEKSVRNQRIITLLVEFTKRTDKVSGLLQLAVRWNLAQLGERCGPEREKSGSGSKTEEGKEEEGEKDAARVLPAILLQSIFLSSRSLAKSCWQLAQLLGMDLVMFLHDPFDPAAPATLAQVLSALSAARTVPHPPSSPPPPSSPSSPSLLPVSSISEPSGPHPLLTAPARSGEQEGQRSDTAHHQQQQQQLVAPLAPEETSGGGGPGGQEEGAGISEPLRSAEPKEGQEGGPAGLFSRQNSAAKLLQPGEDRRIQLKAEEVATLVSSTLTSFLDRLIGLSGRVRGGGGGARDKSDRYPTSTMDVSDVTSSPNPFESDTIPEDRYAKVESQEGPDMDETADIGFYRKFSGFFGHIKMGGLFSGRRGFILGEQEEESVPMVVAPLTVASLHVLPNPPHFPQHHSLISPPLSSPPSFELRRSSSLPFLTPSPPASSPNLIPGLSISSPPPYPTSPPSPPSYFSNPSSPSVVPASSSAPNIPIAYPVGPDAKSQQIPPNISAESPQIWPNIPIAYPVGMAGPPSEEKMVIHGYPTQRCGELDAREQLGPRRSKRAKTEQQRSTYEGPPCTVAKGAVPIAVSNVLTKKRSQLYCCGCTFFGVIWLLLFILMVAINHPTPAAWLPTKQQQNQTQEHHPEKAENGHHHNNHPIWQQPGKEHWLLALQGLLLGLLGPLLMYFLITVILRPLLLLRGGTVTKLRHRNRNRNRWYWPFTEENSGNPGENSEKSEEKSERLWFGFSGDFPGNAGQQAHPARARAARRFHVCFYALLLTTSAVFFGSVHKLFKPLSSPVSELPLALLWAAMAWVALQLLCVSQWHANLLTQTSYSLNSLHLLYQTARQRRLARLLRSLLCLAASGFWLVGMSTTSLPCPVQLWLMLWGCETLVNVQYLTATVDQLAQDSNNGAGPAQDKPSRLLRRNFWQKSRPAQGRKACGWTVRETLGLCAWLAVWTLWHPLFLLVRDGLLAFFLIQRSARRCIKNCNLGWFLEVSLMLLMGLWHIVLYILWAFTNMLLAFTSRKQLTLAALEPSRGFLRRVQTLHGLHLEADTNWSGHALWNFDVLLFIFIQIKCIIVSLIAIVFAVSKHQTQATNFATFVTPEFDTGGGNIDNSSERTHHDGGGSNSNDSFPAGLAPDTNPANKMPPADGYPATQAPPDVDTGTWPVDPTSYDNQQWLSVGGLSTESSVLLSLLTAYFVVELLSQFVKAALDLHKVLAIQAPALLPSSLWDPMESMVQENPVINFFLTSSETVFWCPLCDTHFPIEEEGGVISLLQEPEARARAIVRCPSCVFAVGPDQDALPFAIPREVALSAESINRRKWQGSRAFRLARLLEDVDEKELSLPKAAFNDQKQSVVAVNINPHASVDGAVGEVRLRQRLVTELARNVRDSRYVSARYILAQCYVFHHTQSANELISTLRPDKREAKSCEGMRFLESLARCGSLSPLSEVKSQHTLSSPGEGVLVFTALSIATDLAESARKLLGPRFYTSLEGAVRRAEQLLQREEGAPERLLVVMFLVARSGLLANQKYPAGAAPGHVVFPSFSLRAGASVLPRFLLSLQRRQR